MLLQSRRRTNLGWMRRKKTSQPEVQQTSCETPSVAEYVLTGFSKKLVEEGTKGFANPDIYKMLSTAKTATISKDAQAGYHKCNMVISVRYPADLSGKIGTAFSSESGRTDLQAKLETKLGLVNGPGVFNQINASISDGPYGVVPTFPSEDDFAKYSDTIKKNIDAIFGEQLLVDITYEVTPLKDPNGKSFNEVKWYVNKRDALDLNVAMLNLLGAL